MPRQRRPLSREGEATRDASLIIVASEDTYAAHYYFSRFRTRRVQFRVLPTTDSNSSPAHVIERLDKFKSDYDTAEGDSFWLCIDRDRWNVESLSAVLRECISKGYENAISNPCFDLWILLHHEPLAVDSIPKCDDVISRIRQIMGGYGKKCCSTMAITPDMVDIARERAKQMDNEEMLPSKPMTRVYKIVELLIAKDRLLFIDDPAV